MADKKMVTIDGNTAAAHFEECYNGRQENGYH